MGKAKNLIIKMLNARVRRRLCLRRVNRKAPAFHIEVQK